MKIRCLILFLALGTMVRGQPTEPSQYETHAFALPLTGITIDGDFSDWPESAATYPVRNKMWGDDLTGAEDLSASFKVGFLKAENAIVFALTIKDNATVINDAPTWSNQDTYSFYVNEQYRITGSGVVRYTLAENFRDATDPTDNWDNKLSELVSWDRMEYKVKTIGNQRNLEIKYRLKAPVYVGRTVGVGHMIIDEDQDGSTGIGWVGRGGKSSYSQPGRLGVVTFMDERQQTGILTGKVRWNDPKIPNRPEGIKVISVTDPARWFYFPVDENGRFAAEIPIGKWELHPGMTAFFRDTAFYKAAAEETRTVKVVADQATDFGDFVLVSVPKPDLPNSGNLLAEMDGNAKEKIDRAIEAYMDFYQVEGVAFAAWKDGKLIYDNTYGVSNNYTGKQVNDKTLFEVASITKPAFAFVVMRLVEQGVIDLDKPLYEDLTFDLIEGHEYAKLVTARHVLSHQTGFPNWANGKIEFKFKPGTGYGYSGEGFEYLKRVIEKITGKQINDIIQEELIAPLGLRHFYFQDHAYVRKHKANGHFNGYPGRLDSSKIPMVAYSLVTNPVDFMKFADAIHKRKGLKPETYNLMLSMQNKVPDADQGQFEEHIGLGWFVETTPYGRVIKHGGDNGDFKAMFKLYDDLGLAFMITANGNSGYFLTDHIESILIDAEVMKKQR